MPESPAGELTAAQAGLARLVPELLAVARYLVSSDSDARDLVQHTIEIGLRRFGQLREPTKIRAWLMAIETREVWGWRRRLRHVLSLDAAVREIVAPGGSVASSQARHDTASLLVVAVAAGLIGLTVIGFRSVLAATTCVGVGGNHFDARITTSTRTVGSSAFITVEYPSLCGVRRPSATRGP